jgi:hypothetical protein
MLLKHEDMELLNSYTRDLSRLMFRSLFGCGVVCGLVVDTKKECGKLIVTVGSGVAIACSGDPIWVPRDESIPANDECEKEDDKELWIVLCGTAKCCAPRTATCSSGDDELSSVCTREILGYELRVMNKRPKCVCDCQAKDTSTFEVSRDKQNPAPSSEFEVEVEDETKVDRCLCADPTLPCYEKHYAGECVCSCSQCSDCDCDCVLLARLALDADGKWQRYHNVRRFVRPVLMRDPRPELDMREQAKDQAGDEDKVDVGLEYDVSAGRELSAFLVAEKAAEVTKAKGPKRGRTASTLKPGLPNK